MRNLSKSKLIAFRQCPRRMWLEINQPALAEISAGTEARFREGNLVGDIARRLYDPEGKGALIDAKQEGFGPAFERSQALLGTSAPIFEAGFAAAGALAFADVMLPLGGSDPLTWRMIEVKSSTSVKDYHHDDIAIQAHVALSAGVPLKAIALAHIDSTWVYQGDGDYQGLLCENDLSTEALSRREEVGGWIQRAQAVACTEVEPSRKTGRHCKEPFECPFLEHCQSGEPHAQHPVAGLPSISSKALKTHIEENQVAEMADVPDHLLNEVQLRVKAATLSGKPYFDAAGAIKDLEPHQLPAIFLDFETVMPAVPIWKGTRPYQQVPFQFSAHRISQELELGHVQFLDLTGEDPRPGFALALIEACASAGPVFVYNAGFESARIRELATHLPELEQQLLDITNRIVDLLPVARKRYYNPSQNGSWSIKKVLPAIAPDLRYASLDGVQDGGAAMAAYAEAISPQTLPLRKTEIEQQLLSYCRLDTFAMVRLWQFFIGTHMSSWFAENPIT